MALGRGSLISWDCCGDVLRVPSEAAGRKGKGRQRKGAKVRRRKVTLCLLLPAFAQGVWGQTQSNRLSVECPRSLGDGGRATGGGRDWQLAIFGQPRPGQAGVKPSQTTFQRQIVVCLATDHNRLWCDELPLSSGLKCRTPGIYKSAFARLGAGLLLRRRGWNIRCEDALT